MPDPPKIARQLFGGSSPLGPLPSLNQKRARSGEPGAAFNAAWNQAWSELQWLGTMSSMMRMPRSFASANVRSKSASVP